MITRLALAAGLSTAVLVPATMATPAAASPDFLLNLSPIVKLKVGHVDAVDVAFENGEFDLTVHDETVEPDVERDPAEVWLIALPESAVEVPDDPAYAFLGDPGDTAWVLPEVQDEALLWAGLSAEEVEPGTFTNDSMTVKVVRVWGPGGFSMFDTALDGGPNVLVDSEDGLPDEIALPAGLHKHVNWGFEAPGTYKVKYRVTGKLAESGTTVRSDVVTLTFKVRA